MEFYTHEIFAIALNIVGDNEVTIVEAEVRIADISLNDEMTLEVVATCGTDDINKSLVVRILYGQVLCLGFTPIVLDVNLIGTCKSHTVVILGKLTGDVQPK